MRPAGGDSISCYAWKLAAAGARCSAALSGIGSNSRGREVKGEVFVLKINQKLFRVSTLPSLPKDPRQFEPRRPLVDWTKGSSASSKGRPQPPLKLYSSPMSRKFISHHRAPPPFREDNRPMPRYPLSKRYVHTLNFRIRCGLRSAENGKASRGFWSGLPALSEEIKNRSCGYPIIG